MKSERPYSEMADTGGHRDTGGSAQSGLVRVAARARKEPKERFNSLIHHLSQSLIAEHLRRIPRHSGAGVDGLGVEEVLGNLGWLLQEPLKAIHEGRYQAPPVRRVYIPKADGGQRPIGVPTVLDRGIQAGMAAILGAIYEQDFLNCSFGFRPGRSCHHALATVTTALYRQGLNYALEVDIRDFFGSLDHGWLRKFLEHRISDRRALKLIDAWLKAGVMEDGRLQENERGTPQGGSISPLLANIYLHYVLDLWFERIIKKQLAGKARLVRYCDDFVILFEQREEAMLVMKLLRTRLAQFGLAVAEEKTHVTDLTLRENTGRDRRHMTFLGFSIFKAERRDGKGWKTVCQTERKRFRRAMQETKAKLRLMMHRPVEIQAGFVNKLLIGHMNYYGIGGNAERIGCFRLEVIRFWRRCLSRRSQRANISWQRMTQILDQYRIVKARLKIPYCQLPSYAML